ncbi:hypothetical protein FLL46_08665 [Aliikangiella coralliicola]|uniref:Putative heavy-metal chelation domain-containing protein n=2 Tax=Aliikangiella coralliicola TaxID=2592383 RepID=A0A545UH01_9GAMM|nr:hypothetical protein FLL46_08665 [Aliikangiella coralliicola]
MSELVSINQLIQKVLQGEFSVNPESLPVVGSFWVKQSTQFPGSPQKYHNHYLLLRVGSAFGGCCVELSDIDSNIAAELSGHSVAELLDHSLEAVRVAALDAFFGEVYAHRKSNAKPLALPRGTPLERAVARDQAIADLLDFEPGKKIGLIGVVNPLVDAIVERGGICLPCDFNMKKTQSGLTVVQDMMPVLQEADYILATGMTLSNGSFDTILKVCRSRKIPFVLYAQTGSAIIPQFLDHGVTAISAEPFPYSQFSAEPSTVYLYRSREN